MLEINYFVGMFEVPRGSLVSRSAYSPDSQNMPLLIKNVCTLTLFDCLTRLCYRRDAFCRLCCHDAQRYDRRDRHQSRREQIRSTRQMPSAISTRPSSVLTGFFAPRYFTLFILKL